MTLKVQATPPIKTARARALVVVSDCIRSFSPRLETLSINSPIPVCVADVYSVSENYSIPVRGEIVDPCCVIGARRHEDSMGMWCSQMMLHLPSSPRGDVV